MPKNFRPVSLLCIPAKVMERVIFNKMFSFLKTHGLLTNLQGAYQPDHSTVTQLLEMYNRILKGLDEGSELLFAFADMSKAFDRVSHKGLLYKLEQIGIRGKALAWCRAYLENRKQRVIVNGQSSDESTIQAGVPQGSILGPLFFLIYMNDLPEEIHINLRLYADDVSLFLEYNNREAAIAIMEENLEKLTSWADSWWMTFNPDKSEILNFSRKRNMDREIVVNMEDKEVIQVISHKHLGINLQEDGKWSTHIDDITRKANRRVDILSSLKNLLNRNSLEKLFITYIRPILEYGNVIWSNLNHYEATELEKIQLKAARVVLGAKKGTSHAKLYDDLGWATLENRRKYHCLVQFYKIKHGNAPELLTEIIPRNISQRSTYQTRNIDDMDIPRGSTEIYLKSFIPETSRNWNNLPDTTKYLNNLEDFKERVMPTTILPPPYYSTGERALQILHTRLRLENADTNENLFQRNLSVTEECRCGAETESTEHYLLECPNFAIERQTMFLNLSNLFNPAEISVDILLKGSDHLSDNSNAEIFRKCMSFIKETKRFSK